MYSIPRRTPKTKVRKLNWRVKGKKYQLIPHLPNYTLEFAADITRRTTEVLQPPVKTGMVTTLMKVLAMECDHIHDERDTRTYQIFRQIVGLEAAGVPDEEIERILQLPRPVHVLRKDEPYLFSEAEHRVGYELNMRFKRHAMETWEILAAIASEALLFLKDIMDGGTPKNEERSFAPVEKVTMAQRQDAAKAIGRYFAAISKAKIDRDKKQEIPKELGEDFEADAHSEDESCLERIS